MLKKLFFSIVFNGLKDKSTLKVQSRTAVFNSISFIGVAILLAFTVIDIIQDELLIAFMTGLTSLLIVVILIIVGLTKKITIGTTFISYLMFIFFQLILYSQGAERAGFFWILLYPLISMFFLGIIHGSILTVLFGISSYILMFHVPQMIRKVLIVGMAERSLGAYIGVTLFTVAFEIVRIKAFDQLESTSNDLLEKRKQTSMILENVKQGIFLLNKDLVISEERSDFFNNLFGRLKINQSFVDLIKDKLPQRDFVATKDYLELFFNKTVNPTLLNSINPIEKILMNFPQKASEESQIWLEFDFERVVLLDGEIQILGLFRDITEQVNLEEQLKREESESLRNMENLFQIIHVNPELMDEFIKDTNEEIDSINELLKVETKNTEETINRIFSQVHSIKGNALLLGLQSIGKKLQDFEDFIKELKELDPTWRDLLKLTINLAEVKHDISQIDELIDKILSFQKKAGDKVNNKKFLFEESLKKSTLKLAKEYKREVKLDLEKYNIELIPDKYRKLLKDSINQFIRNSIAHGIESPDERVKNGKNREGLISLSLVKREEKLYISYKDDGNGLNLQKIKDMAMEKKGYSFEQINSLTGAEIVKLIFSPGFSTTEESNLLSGQGIGMSVIKNHIDSVGGKLNIKSGAGKYCEFIIVLQL